MNRLRALLRLDPALDADNFGFVEEFHAEEVFGVDLLNALVFLGNLIPGNFVVGVAVSRNVELAFSIFVDALKD